MNQSYNVVVSSNLCAPESALSPAANKNYYIDWSAILPQSEFELTFSFISENNIINTFQNLPCIYVDFLSQANIDICRPSYQATSSTFLGLVFPTNLDANAHRAYLRADKNFNPPIYLANRPYANNFNISILNNANPPVNWVDDTAAGGLDIGQYVLVFHFKPLKKAV